MFVIENRDYIQTYCNDHRNTFHFTYQWYTYMDSYTNNSIIIYIFV